MRKTLVACLLAASMIPVAALAKTSTAGTKLAQIGTVGHTDCPNCRPKVKRLPKPSGTGGYESPGYANGGGGYRIKPQGGVQHSPPSQPVRSMQQP